MSLSKKNKLIIVVLLVIAVVGFTIYKYAMQPPAKIESKKIDFSGTSDELLLKITENTEEWQDKVVLISGKITSIEDKGIVLSSSIYCQLKNPIIINQIDPNNYITLKGRVIGYDDLLEELKLDQCIIQ
tara:strand:+ start:1146 stop:1532 length:387 start_codon:yes stop_codon:yes gene_type:complete